MLIQSLPLQRSTPLEWLDRKSSPAPSTHGDLPRASYVQAGLGGAVEGLAMAGPAGAVSACCASLAGVWVERATGRTSAAIAAGAAVGAGIGVGIAYLMGNPDLGGQALTGGILGAFETMGGSAAARVRDSSDFGGVLSGVFLPGASKAAGGLASALTARYGSELSSWQRALLGAGVGAALGAGVGAAGLGAGIAVTAAAAALGGGLGPVIGPRFGQLIRNVSHDLGDATQNGMLRAGFIEKPFSPAVSGCIGALPAGLLSEFGKSWVYSDGNLWGLALGGLTQSIQLVDIFTNSQPNDEEEVYATLP